LVLQDIKRDLRLSDTQLGFMTGIAFALFYSMLGVPLARWADSGNRITIITLTTAVWSVMVALCGWAVRFPQLMLIRIGVGVGEAGCIPPAQSLMADHFTREERPRASAIYQLGVPLSFVVGYFVAGWINQLYGWRTMFVWLGLPGLVLSVLVWFTLQEPRRGRSVDAPLSTGGVAQSSAPSFKDVCVFLWRNSTFRHLLLAYSVMYFFGYGILQWQPTFFIRSFGMSTGSLGTWFAVVFGGFGFAGTYWGGHMASRYAKGDERLQLRAISVMYCVLAVLSFSVYLCSNMYLALALLAVFAFGQYSIAGPLLATIQTLIPERMRATAIAIIYLFANLIGMGLGPLAAGMMSDALRPAAGDESLRYSLLILSPGYFWVAWHMARASKTVTGAIEAVHSGATR
jgi:predicted MFS family arabinose efflux permease